VGGKPANENSATSIKTI